MKIFKDTKIKRSKLYRSKENEKFLLLKIFFLGAMELYILLLNPSKLPNFLTKFPTEPEVNLSCRSLRLLHYGRFLKKVIISPYFSLSDGENCPKMHFFGIKLSRLAFFEEKLSKFELFLVYIAKICKFRGKNWKILGKKYQNLHFFGLKLPPPHSYFFPPPTSIWQNIHLWTRG